ncbi:hypothetical protein OESDEN_03525 [Oesophagostomum dentatum]|uniref:glucuronosyltransferase n=1 Tax=Oesophagostomum dentatum TaxID=61180 RepID=A0A0B1TK71_OESDE|nr:hypothetical protein OESDEN_03525 [Oesophagostomum dentatum]
MNFITSLLSDIAIKGLIVRKHEEVFARHGVSASEDDFYYKTNYLLSNSDEFLEDARPITAKIIHIGGIALTEKAQLNNEFQELMDRKDRVGAVYISFGSIVPTKEMPSVFREAIIHVAEAFPKITFIWKVDKDDSVPQLANLHTFAWLPQQALLDHPKLLCFVSHAGLNSVLEVTRSGKPSILVPIFGDQFRNSRLVEAKNTTVVMSKENFNNQTFEETLRHVLSDESLIKQKESRSWRNSRECDFSDFIPLSQMKLLLLLVLTSNAIESYKILVYSAPLGYSHMQFMGRMADILQEAGHEVTVLHPVWMPKYLHGVSKMAKQVCFPSFSDCVYPLKFF